MSDVPVTRLDGPAPEKEIAFDLLKRAAWIAPIVLVVASLFWGFDGAVSAAYALAIVTLNFLVSAALLAVTARISLGLMMGAALFGYLLRLGLILVAILAVRDASWLSPWPLGLTLIGTHLGLLFWEMKHVSASLAFPGLKPGAAPKESSRS